MHILSVSKFTSHWFFILCKGSKQLKLTTLFSPGSSKIQKKGYIYSDPQNDNLPESTYSSISAKPNKQLIFKTKGAVIK
jgi:hypothetical protein